MYCVFPFSLHSLILASPSNIRLGCKDLPWMNATAYFDPPSVTKKKSFYKGPNVVKFLQTEFTNFCNRIECLSMASFSNQEPTLDWTT